MRLVTTAQKICIQDWVVEQGLQYDVEVARLSKIIQPPDSLFGTGALVGVNFDILFVR